MEPATAIVTGAGKRVGKAIADALVERGWTVVAHVREARAAVPANTVTAVADLSERDCAERIFAAAGGLPPVRLLVNCAARFAHDDLAQFDPAELDAHIAINVRAPVLLTQALAAGHATGEALIVNILDAKLASPNADFLSYTMSKQALAGFTELAARALASKSIRVNGIAPSLMLRSAGQSEANFHAMHRANPLRRGVGTDDLVAAIDYLLASPAVTGEVLLIDGGQRFWALDRDVQFLEPDDRPDQT